MKTFVVVLGALLATATPAFAHGGGESGAPVTAPGGGGQVIFSPSASYPGSPVFSPAMPEIIAPRDPATAALQEDRQMRHPRRVAQNAIERPYTICRVPGPDLLAPQFYMFRAITGDCTDVATQDGMLRLPPAFMW